MAIFTYKIEPAEFRRREARDWWAMFRSALGILWALAFVLFTANAYISVGGIGLVLVLWFAVTFGSALMLGGRFVKSNSIGHRHRVARMVEFIGCALAGLGHFAYFTGVLLYILFVPQDWVPALDGFLSFTGSPRTAVFVLSIVMFSLAAERFFEIRRLIRIDHDDNVVKVKL